MEDFEKLGAFYLGKAYDLGRRQLQDGLLLYDSKDLTTHAVCVGMTGSGKTGLCLALLEEAAIDGIPAIAIDPKGDIANLALAFPALDAASFLPWIDEAEAARRGTTAEQFAAETAARWKEGLAEWGQDPARIARFRDAVDVSIYTPGSNAGLPIAVLRSFAAPSKELREDADTYRAHLTSTASGLLALLGMDADPVQSREHILISTLLDCAWREGRDEDVGSLIHQIQEPPIERIGVVDLETFYPRKDRTDLAMRLNSLLASPSFSGWMEGEPLSVGRLLHTPQGKPRLSIISIAHLSDAERMFFVTLLLNAVVEWTRTCQGTSSLRGILYMDEVFGYFPPVANPPSKRPMLTLLKQARAFGLGIVLATQNPVDLDYRGLSNIGTWFLGRLQTARDKARVLEGLEGAAVQTGGSFDREAMDGILSALGNRVFLMNNVHDDEPVVFHTRWVLSYLRGPLAREQIKRLTPKTVETTPEVPAPAEDAAVAAPAHVPGRPRGAQSPPSIPAEVTARFLAAAVPPLEGTTRVYRPAILGNATLHYSRASYEIDQWESQSFLAPLSGETKTLPWTSARCVRADALVFSARPEPGASFDPGPGSLTQAKSYPSWEKQLKALCYRTQARPVWKCAALKAVSVLGESEGAFRARVTHLAREKRDAEVERLRARYAGKMATLKNRIQTAQQALQREKSEAGKASLDSAVSFGSSLLGALFGRKLASASNVRRASSSLKSAGGAAKQRGDVTIAQEKLAQCQAQLSEMEERFSEECRELEAAYHPESLELESVRLKPVKSDTQIEPLCILWMPWDVDPSGIAEPAFEIETKAIEESRV